MEERDPRYDPQEGDLWLSNDSRDKNRGLLRVIKVFTWTGEDPHVVVESARTGRKTKVTVPIRAGGRGYRYWGRGS